MKAIVKMEVTLYDDKGHDIVHDNLEQVCETITCYNSNLHGQNFHTEELDFKWVSIISNDIVPLA